MLLLANSLKICLQMFTSTNASKKGREKIVDDEHLQPPNNRQKRAKSQHYAFG